MTETRITKAVREQLETLTVAEVATLLKLSEATIKNLAAKGELPGIKVGRSWRFRPSDLGGLWS